MANNDFVRLAQGAQNDYAALTKDANTLYFCTDTQRLFLGDKEYTRPITIGSSAPTTASASQYPPYSLYFNNNAATGGILYYTDGAAWNQIYNLTQIADALDHRFDDQTPQPARTVLAAPGASGVTNLYPGTAQSGYYISDSGVVTADSSLCYSDPIDVAYGDIIYVEGVHHNASVSGNKSLHGYSGSGTDSWVSCIYRANVSGDPGPYGFYVIINNQSITKVRLVHGITDTNVCIYTNASAGAPSFRKLTLLDLPNFNQGNGISLNRAGDQSNLTITVNQQLLSIPTSATYYYPLFSNSTTNNSGGIYKSDTYQIRLKKGTTGQNGYAQLRLGNNIGSGSNNNSEGYITLYSTGTNAVYICASSGSTSPSYYFPVNNISGSRYIASIASNTAVGSSLKPVYVASNGVVTECEFNPLSTVIATLSPNPLIVRSDNGLQTYVDATIGANLSSTYMQIGGVYTYTAFGEDHYLGGKLMLGLEGSTPRKITLGTLSNSGDYDTTYLFNASTSTNTNDVDREVVYKPLSGYSVGNSTTPVYIDVDGRAIACTLTPSSVGLSNVTNHAQINNIGLVTGESTAANNGITKTVGTTTSVAITQADLQSAIFIISDTAPDDTSVIWLKPVSE